MSVDLSIGTGLTAILLQTEVSGKMSTMSPDFYAPFDLYMSNFTLFGETLTEHDDSVVITSVDLEPPSMSPESMTACSSLFTAGSEEDQPKLWSEWSAWGETGFGDGIDMLDLSECLLTSTDSAHDASLEEDKQPGSVG